MDNIKGQKLISSQGKLGAEEVKIRLEMVVNLTFAFCSPRSMAQNVSAQDQQSSRKVEARKAISLALKVRILISVFRGTDPTA